MKRMVYWIMMFILGLGLLGCESAQSILSSGPSKPPPEDPAIGIVKRTLMTDGYWEDFCNRAAGVDGKVEWVGGPASALSNVEKYKYNPDLSIVVVRIEKNRTGEYSKVGVLFVVNKKTKAVEVMHTELDGKGKAPLITLASMEQMGLQGSK